MAMKNVIALCLAIVMPAAAASDAGLAQLVDVRIYDRATQRELALVSSGGRYFVAGTPGSEYSIRLRNRAGEDVLAVVSVDGVNVVSGETAAVGQSGYILGRGQRFDIKGWRKSLDEVAAFYFSRTEDAYASRTGRPEDIGVIGVAVFRRKFEPPAVEAPRSQREWPAAADKARRDNAAGAASESAANAPRPEAPRLGTGHGARESSVVRHARFERATRAPEQLVLIEYDTRENLVARGILPRPHREPRAFPAQFVPDPPRR
jgi:hypothetical protein